MHRTIASWEAFREAWSGPLNFMVTGDCLPLAFPFPPVARVVEEVRTHPEARIASGRKGARLDMGDTAAAFRALPIEQALAGPFSLAHFRLSVFDHPGGFLHGFKDRVLDPWQDALRAAGFTWERCYPIVFITGADSATNYHMDFSHVLAWQIHGRKRFCGLREPDRWAPQAARLNYRPEAFERPADLRGEDALCYDMGPGDALWNVLLTPHWVEAGLEPAMSVNLSHGGLRRDGRLCPNEEELEAFRRTHPGRGAFQASY